MCSKLAMLLGESTSSQTENTSPIRMPTTVPTKKMTPKRKLNIGWWIILLVVNSWFILYDFNLFWNYIIAFWDELVYATKHGFMNELVCVKFLLLYITCNCVWINLLLAVYDNQQILISHGYSQPAASHGHGQQPSSGRSRGIPQYSREYPTILVHFYVNICIYLYI